MSELCKAAREGWISRCRQLLADGSDVEEKDEDGWMPLLIAAKKGFTEVCEVLLEKGKANIEETTPNGNTALMLAVCEGCVSSVGLLLLKGARVDTINKNGFTPLLLAAFYGHTEVCKLLIEKGSEEREEVFAAAKGDARKVSQGGRVDARERGFTPLLVAANNGHTDVCELLLEKGKANIEEIDADGNTALILAASEGDGSTVAGHPSTVALLLSKGARVDTRAKDGFTPLLAAAQFGHTEVCKLLLKMGKANVKETTPDGFTALLTAALGGHTEVCKLLLETGKANIEEKTPLGSTALNIAAMEGNASTVALLLSKGARVDTRDRDGFTSLLLAADKGHTKV